MHIEIEIRDDINSSTQDENITKVFEWTILYLKFFIFTFGIHNVNCTGGLQVNFLTFNGNIDKACKRNKCFHLTFDLVVFFYSFIGFETWVSVSVS